MNQKTFLNKFRIIEPITSGEWESYYQLRFEILRKPWNQTPDSTHDEWEDLSLHILMIDDKNEAVATGRLQFNSETEGQIRSMAVRTDMQGRHLGSEVLKHIENKASVKKLETLILDARDTAVNFYKKNGYEIIGDSYSLFGVIPHFRMKKNL